MELCQPLQTLTQPPEENIYGTNGALNPKPYSWYKGRPNPSLRVQAPALTSSFYVRLKVRANLPVFCLDHALLRDLKLVGFMAYFSWIIPECVHQGYGHATETS